MNIPHGRIGELETDGGLVVLFKERGRNGRTFYRAYFPYGFIPTVSIAEDPLLSDHDNFERLVDKVNTHMIINQED